MTQEGKTDKKNNNGVFQDLIFNILIPILILKKGDDILGWPASWVLVLALAFPIGMGSKDFLKKRKVNLFSILGVINVILTGVIGLMALSPEWVAVKEALVPLVIGAVLIGSMWTPFPLVKKILYNPQIMNIELIESKLKELQNEASFEKTLTHATWIMGASFLLSAVLNFLLARILVTTSPAVDMAQFNNELSSMWAWSMVVIVIPCMCVTFAALWVILRGIRKHAGLTLEQVLVGMEEKPGT
jgi:intracellular septation protein A